MKRKRGNAQAKNRNASPVAEPAPSPIDGPLVLQICRRERKIPLETIAAATKINLGILSALEQEQFARLPDARVYVRGFVRSFAQALQLDAETLTEAYIQRWQIWRDNACNES